jgi:hypothetical protein
MQLQKDVELLVHEKKELEKMKGEMEVSKKTDYCPTRVQEQGYQI